MSDDEVDEGSKFDFEMLVTHEVDTGDRFQHAVLSLLIASISLTQDIFIVALYLLCTPLNRGLIQCLWGDRDLISLAFIFFTNGFLSLRRSIGFEVILEYMAVFPRDGATITGCKTWSLILRKSKSAHAIFFFRL